MEDGFYGAWFIMIILKRFLEKCFIRYDEFVNENDNSKHLLEMVQISQLQPIPPNINKKSWVKNDVIEVYESDCWWVGKIIKYLLRENKYVVDFPKSSQEMQVDASCIHIHQDWVQSNNVHDFTWELHIIGMVFIIFH